MFEEKTTYKNDYNIKIPETKRKLHYWPKKRCENPPKKLPAVHLQDHQTLQYLRKNVHVPFNALWTPKPIVGTDPRTIIELPAVPVDKDKEKVMATRPRLYISPALSIDDVPDPEMRKLLIQHMYSSEWEKAAKEAALPSTKLPDILNYHGPTGIPVTYEVNIMPPLGSAWRKIGTVWPNNKNVTTVDPTCEFWLQKDSPVMYTKWEDKIPKEKSEEIAELISNDTLRMAHDRPIPTYAGYKPQLSRGTAWSKKSLDVTHPFLSVTQAITKRYADDSQS